MQNLKSSVLNPVQEPLVMSRPRINLACLTCGGLVLAQFFTSPLAAFDLLQQPAADTPAASASAAPEPAIDEAKLRTTLADAVRQDPILRGSWVKVIVEEDKSLRVVLVVDLDKSIGSQQEARLRDLVKLNTDAKFDRFGPTEKLPVAALLTKIIHQTEDDPQLAGVRIRDAYFTPRSTPEQLYLKLRGSILKMDQAETLRTLCNDKWLLEVIGPVLAATMIVDTDPVMGSENAEDGLTLRTLSPAAASAEFQSGIDAFIKQDYPKSLKSLTMATQDDPNRPEIKYWCCAALIALKQHDRAREIVKKLTPTNQGRNPYYSSQVLRSLERINGANRTPIRQELDTMVRNALSSP
jgi:hypothetical protein